MSGARSFCQRGIVEPLGKLVRRVLGEEEALDRGAPRERVVPLADAGQDVLGVARFRAEAGVLEAVDAVFQADADLVLAVRVRDDGLAALVRRLDDRADLVLRHLVLVDQLDDVDAGVDDLLHLGARVRRAVDAPAVLLFVLGVRGVLDEGTRDEEARPGNLALLDPVAHLEDVVRAGARGPART